MLGFLGNMTSAPCCVTMGLLRFFSNATNKTETLLWLWDRLCGLVVSVEDYKHRGPGFDSRALLRIFLRELGLERVTLSLVIG
jgi:hypothetical protein